MEAMEKELGWRIGDWFTIKADDRGPDLGYHFYRPGPVVGVVTDRVTNDRNQMRKAPPGTRFFGKVYVVPGKTPGGAPGEVIAVYDRVKLPNRDEVPVCFVVGGDGASAPIREFKGDTAKATSQASGTVVDSWR
jgi:eukaryotic-like serine/threonine-protein kinase